MSHPNPPMLRRLIPLLFVATGAALAACDRSAPPADDGGGAATPTATADERPLNAELRGFVGLIESHRTGPARVRIVKYEKLHGKDAATRFLFGLTYHREKRYEQAREHFDEATALAPNYPLPYYFRGWADYYLGDLGRARTDFERHLELAPDVADSHFGLGLVELEEDRLDAAEARFRRSLELIGDDADEVRERSKALARLGDVHMMRGEWEAARAVLQEASDLYEDHYEAHYKLYRVLTRLGDEDGAAAALALHDRVKARLHPGTAFPE